MKKIFIAALLLCGCTSKNFYESTIGSSTTIGLILPSENITNFEVLNSLEGSKIKIKEPCNVYHYFAMTNTTTWFGLVDSKSAAHSLILLSPSNSISDISSNTKDIH